MSRTQTFYEIATLDFSYLVTVKSTVEILQNFVAFSEYMNFNWYTKTELALLFAFQSQCGMELKRKMGHGQ